MTNSSLTALHPGDFAIIQGISADEALHHRLTALGFRIGREIQLIRRAWFKGPLHVRIGTTEIILRLADADKIRIVQQPPK